MTDAEKELRRLAQEEASGDGLGHFREEATPAAVLALLDRIEVLETKLEAMRKHSQATRGLFRDGEPGP